MKRLSNNLFFAPLASLLFRPSKVSNYDNTYRNLSLFNSTQINFIKSIKINKKKGVPSKAESGKSSKNNKVVSKQPFDKFSPDVTTTTNYLIQQLGFDPFEITKTWVRSWDEHLQMLKKQQQAEIKRLDKMLLGESPKNEIEQLKSIVSRKKDLFPFDDTDFFRLGSILAPQNIMPQSKTVTRQVEPDGRNVVTTVEKFVTGEGTIDDPRTTYTRTTTESFYEDEEKNGEKVDRTKLKGEDKKAVEITSQKPQTPQKDSSGDLTATSEENKDGSVVITKDLPGGGKEKTVTNTTVEKLPDGMKKTTTKTTSHITYPDGFEQSESKIVIVQSSDEKVPRPENSSEQKQSSAS